MVKEIIGNNVSIEVTPTNDNRPITFRRPRLSVN